MTRVGSSTSRALMRRCARAARAAILLSAVALTSACNDINTDPTVVASISLDSVGSPSVIAGDTLRDTLGIVRFMRATAYNIQGDPLVGYPVRFRSPDLGVTVDSVTGLVIADSARPTPIRLLAEAGGLQSTPDTIYVVQTPDSVIAVNPSDSLLYSLRDSTVNVSAPLGVRVVHRTTPALLDPVRGYLVSYTISYPSDTVLAHLVGDDGVSASRVDTTDASGTAGRRIRLRPGRLSAITDSVVVYASVRFRGAVVAGAPLKFFLLIKPRP